MDDRQMASEEQQISIQAGYETEIRNVISNNMENVETDGAEASSAGAEAIDAQVSPCDMGKAISENVTEHVIGITQSTTVSAGPQTSASPTAAPADTVLSHQTSASPTAVPADTVLSHQTSISPTAVPADTVLSHQTSASPTAVPADTVLSHQTSASPTAVPADTVLSHQTSTSPTAVPADTVLSHQTSASPTAVPADTVLSHQTSTSPTAVPADTVLSHQTSTSPSVAGNAVAGNANATDASHAGHGFPGAESESEAEMQPEDAESKLPTNASPQADSELAREMRGREDISPTPSRKRKASAGSQQQGLLKRKRRGSQDTKMSADSEASHERRVLLPRRAGIEWKPGAKLEALDFQRNCRYWYTSRIVSVNEQSASVLVHFDGWNSKFDQWIEMRSEKLRAMSSGKEMSANSPQCRMVSWQEVKVGTVVLAKWSSSKYPAIVKELLPKKKLNIEFYDGVKIETDLSSVQPLDSQLQKEALHVWDVMKEVAEEPRDLPNTVKSSRRASIEVNKLHKAKMDAAEVLLSQLIEKCSVKSAALSVDHMSTSPQTSGTSPQARVTSPYTGGAMLPSPCSETSRANTVTSRPSSSSSVCGRTSVDSADAAAAVEGTTRRLKSDGVSVQSFVLASHKPQPAFPQPAFPQRAFLQPALVKRLLYRKKLALEFCDGTEHTMDLSAMYPLHVHLQKDARFVWDAMKEFSIKVEGKHVSGSPSSNSSKKSEAQCNIDVAADVLSQIILQNGSATTELCDSMAPSAIPIALDKASTSSMKSHNKPATSESKPAAAGSKPVKSGKPAKLDSEPAESDSKRAKSDSKPAKSDSKPAKSDSKPAKSGSKPAKSDSKPAKSNSKPAKSDSKPAKSDSKPAKSDSKPAKSDSKPTKSDSKPTKSGSKPAKSNSKPTKSNSKTTKSNSKPAKSRSKPATLMDKPAKSRSRPAKSDIKPTKLGSKPAKSDIVKTKSVKLTTAISKSMKGGEINRRVAKSGIDTTGKPGTSKAKLGSKSGMAKDRSTKSASGGIKSARDKICKVNINKAQKGGKGKFKGSNKILVSANAKLPSRSGYRSEMSSSERSSDLIPLSKLNSNKIVLLKKLKAVRMKSKLSKTAHKQLRVKMIDSLDQSAEEAKRMLVEGFSHSTESTPVPISKVYQPVEDKEMADVVISHPSEAEQRVTFIESKDEEQKILPLPGISLSPMPKRAASTPTKQLSSDVSVVLTPTSKETIEAHVKSSLCSQLAAASHHEPESQPQSASEEEPLPPDESLDSDMFSLSTDCDVESTELPTLAVDSDLADARLSGADSVTDIATDAQCRAQISLKLHPVLLENPGASASSAAPDVSAASTDLSTSTEQSPSEVSEQSRRRPGRPRVVRPSHLYTGEGSGSKQETATVRLERKDLTSSNTSRMSSRVAGKQLARKAVEEAKAMPLGYTVVLEPVDARPAKAFIVDDKEQAQFRCSYCQKCFRKDSLLVSHIKYNHGKSSANNQSTSVAPRKTHVKSSSPVQGTQANPMECRPSQCNSEVVTPPGSGTLGHGMSAQSRPLSRPLSRADDSSLRRRNRIKTVSVCSSDSEISAAPYTPLTSPTPPSNCRKQAAEVHIRGEDSDYDCDTDSNSDAGSSYQSEVVNCKCGFNEEDNLMVQCEFCCCWQHAECFGIQSDSLPDQYLCYVCLDTPGVRESKRYLYRHNWRKQGMLPKLDGTELTEEDKKAARLMRRTQRQRLKIQQNLSALSSIRRLLDSAAKCDTYELALWSSDEEISPDVVDPTPTTTKQTENLLQRVHNKQNYLQDNLNSIKAVVSALEMEAGIKPPAEEDHISANQSLGMLIADMQKVQVLASLQSESRTETPHDASTKGISATEKLAAENIATANT